MVVDETTQIKGLSFTEGIRTAILHGLFNTRATRAVCIAGAGFTVVCTMIAPELFTGLGALSQPLEKFLAGSTPRSQLEKLAFDRQPEV